MKPETLHREFAPLSGKTKDEIDTIAQGCFEEYVRDDIYPQAADLVRSHLDSGDTVILASTSLDVLVSQVADHLGVQTTIASKLEYREGYSTGRTDGPPCFGSEKRRRVLSYLDACGLEPKDTVFYSDSIHDLPLLAVIGKPVAVNPDLQLRRLARRRGWEVHEFSKPGKHADKAQSSRDYPRSC
jgi:HAD superfamily hydrolase (TIGR01490 family)